MIQEFFSYLFIWIKACKSYFILNFQRVMLCICSLVFPVSFWNGVSIDQIKQSWNTNHLIYWNLYIIRVSHRVRNVICQIHFLFVFMAMLTIEMQELIELKKKLVIRQGSSVQINLCCLCSLCLCTEKLEHGRLERVYGERRSEAWPLSSWAVLWWDLVSQHLNPTGPCGTHT